MSKRNWRSGTQTLTDPSVCDRHDKKLVINDNGGAKQQPDFMIEVHGNNPSPNVFPAHRNSTTVLVGEGQYRVIEWFDSDYSTTYSQDCSGNIAAGQTKLCIITNNDTPRPTLD